MTQVNQNIIKYILYDLFRSQSLILLDLRHHTLIRYYISSANTFNKRGGI